MNSILAKKPAITVCLLPQEGGISFVEVIDDVDSYYELLGDYMEVFPLPSDLTNRRGNQRFTGLCGENGRQRRRAHREVDYNRNSAYLGRAIIGPVVIVATSGPNFVSLTPSEIAILASYFPSTSTVAPAS